MTCNCNKNHKVTALAYTAGTSLVLTVTDSTNINNLEEFNFFLPCCGVDVASTVTGAPVNVYININGTNYPVYNKFHLPVQSNYLYRRKLYKAWFVNDGTTAWLEFQNLPICKAHA